VDQRHADSVQRGRRGGGGELVLSDQVSHEYNEQVSRSQ
jgi:hypothetical protein